MKFILFICILFGIVPFSTAQDRAIRFDSLFTALQKANGFSGNVLIAENGKPIFQKSYGKAFREKGLDLNSESLFDLASVSKQFTAMGIMLLKKEGKLNYDDSLSKFFPQLPYEKITIRHLLQHSSGLPDYIDMAEKHWDNKKIMTNHDMISMLANQKAPARFVPGERWEYSNTGYALLASIIENVSGRSFNDYLTQNIFKPLGMKRTTVFRKRFEKRALENYAYGYVKDSTGKFVMADSLPSTARMVYTMDGIYGDGVVNSTTNDLLKWDQALYTERLLNKSMMQEAFTEAVLKDGKTTGYGFGWILFNNKNIGRVINHSGGWPGYATWIERHPRDNKTIILLANASHASGSIKAIRNILYGLAEVPPKEIVMENEVLKSFEGTYLFPGKDSLHVFVEDGKLFGEGSNLKKHQLRGETSDTFFRDGYDYKIQFVKDSTGRVDHLKVIREGPGPQAIKIKN